MAEIADSELQEMANQIQNLTNDNRWWENALSKHENFPYYALHAVRKGFISVKSFANICCYWGGIQEEKKHGVQILPIPLYDENDINAPNQLLVDVLESQKAYDENFSRLRIEKAICQVLNEGSSFDKTLFKIKLNENFSPLKESYCRQPDMLYGLSCSASYNIMMFTSDEKYLMVPSFTLFEALLKEKFDCPSLPNLVLGKSRLEDIRKNGETHRRDCALPFPGIFFKAADGNPCRSFLSFIFHDMYHSYVASCAGVQTEAFINVAKIIRAHARSLDRGLAKEKKELYHLACIIEDMEIYRYEMQSRVDLKPSELFTIDLIDAIRRAESDGSSVIPYEKILADIKINFKKWSEYGISLDDISKIEPSLHLFIKRKSGLKLVEMAKKLLST
jgi:hypothetical protein